MLGLYLSQLLVWLTSLIWGKQVKVFITIRTIDGGSMLRWKFQIKCSQDSGYMQTDIYASWTHAMSLLFLLIRVILDIGEKGWAPHLLFRKSPELTKNGLTPLQQPILNILKYQSKPFCIFLRSYLGLEF